MNQQLKALRLGSLNSGLFKKFLYIKFTGYFHSFVIFGHFFAIHMAKDEKAD